MSEWVETTLREVLRLEYGKPLRELERDGRGSPVYGSNGAVGLHSRPLIAGPGIVVGRKGSAGSVVYVEMDFFPIDTTYFVQLEADNCMMQFAAHLLDNANLPSVTAQTGVPGLNRHRAYTIPILLPSLAEQRRIVDVIAAVDAQIEALTGESERSRVTYVNATSLLWSESDGQEAQLRSIGEMMTLDIERMTLAHDEVYSIAGVLGSGQGMINKGRFRGSETEYRAMNVLRANQVVMRKLTAWEGPITVVPAAFDGFLASNEFPTFTLNSGVNPAWMRHVCRTQRLWDEMKNRVTGSVQRRKRLSPEQLLVAW